MCRMSLQKLALFLQGLAHLASTALLTALECENDTPKGTGFFVGELRQKGVRGVVKSCGGSSIYLLIAVLLLLQGGSFEVFRIGMFPLPLQPLHEWWRLCFYHCPASGHSVFWLENTLEQVFCKIILPELPISELSQIPSWRRCSLQELRLHAARRIIQQQGAEVRTKPKAVSSIAWMTPVSPKAPVVLLKST